MEMWTLMFGWLLDLIGVLADAGTWLTTDIVAGITPLGLFTASGFAVVIGFHVAHLLNVVFG